jgi:hypothetical protein
VYSHSVVSQVRLRRRRPADLGGVVQGLCGAEVQGIFAGPFFLWHLDGIYVEFMWNLCLIMEFIWDSNDMKGFIWDLYELDHDLKGFNGIYSLIIYQLAMEHYIAHLKMINMMIDLFKIVMFHSYVKLPEGI